MQENNKKTTKQVAHYWLSHFLTYFLFTFHDISYYINNYWISILGFNSPPVQYNFYPVVLPNWRVSAFARFIFAGLYKKLNQNLVTNIYSYVSLPQDIACFSVYYYKNDNLLHM